MENISRRPIVSYFLFIEIRRMANHRITACIQMKTNLKKIVVMLILRFFMYKIKSNFLKIYFNKNLLSFLTKSMSKKMFHSNKKIL